MITVQRDCVSVQVGVFANCVALVQGAVGEPGHAETPLRDIVDILLQINTADAAYDVVKYAANSTGGVIELEHAEICENLTVFDIVGATEKRTVTRGLKEIVTKDLRIRDSDP